MGNGGAWCTANGDGDEVLGPAGASPRRDIQQASWPSSPTSIGCCQSSRGQYGSGQGAEDAWAAEDAEEVIGSLSLRTAAQERRYGGAGQHSLEPPLEPGSVVVNMPRGKLTRDGSFHVPRLRCHWRIVSFGLLVFASLVISAFADGWLRSQDSSTPTWESVLKYGSIPIVAAVIGYGTNVVALWMMFYPIRFIGWFPQARIGCGLDLPLFGWQGVIPMKAREMAEISVDLMTDKLIKVEEIFDRLSPEAVAKEVQDIFPEVAHKVLTQAGKKHCPTLWEYLPPTVRSNLEVSVNNSSGSLMAEFILDLQRNIATAFDLKYCTVERMSNNPKILNLMFLTCGKEEFEFIRLSGFYLGFLLGLLQMVVWMWFKHWWVLPLCGVGVGYLTNVIALKVIFCPVQPWPSWRSWPGPRLQGLFLKRQEQVAALYAEMVASKVLRADVLMESLLTGPCAPRMFELVDKHVEDTIEAQAVYCKPFLLMSFGGQTWVDFKRGVCIEFREQLPVLLARITDYTQEALQLEETIRERLSALPAPEFERLLHAVFEQDEIKLILVGALLGAIVGFLQALAQTPEQFGIAF